MKQLFPLALVLSLILPTLALSVEPEEMLADPVLEARAQQLDEQLRCVKCQSESIASSNADWAKEARKNVRERLSAGDTDAEVLAWFQERWGDFVLMRPTRSGANWILWAAGPVMLLLAGALGLAFVRRRSRETPQGAEPLNEAEQARLAEIMKD
ncbi:MAG: cytochrome c-type biogenesis protein CcmH [Paracoccaceae bacterium]